MTLETLCLRDAEEIEAFYTETTGMQPGFLQLSPGRVDLDARSLELAGVSIVWVGLHGRTYWRDQQQPGTIQFGFAIDAARAPVVRGREIGRDQALVWIPGQEMEYLLSGPVQTLEIGVSSVLVEELGWCIDGEPLRELPAGCREMLAQTCRLAAISVEQDDLESVLSWRDAILDCLELALQPWTRDKASLAQDGCRSRYVSMLKRADEYFARRGYGAHFDADHLAASLGVPRRTVFHAYRQILGLGPRRYFELKRLHELRRRLRDPASEHDTITSIATDLGFTDLGRMAARYRELFCENPRDTERGRELR